MVGKAKKKKKYKTRQDIHSLKCCMNIKVQNKNNILFTTSSCPQFNKLFCVCENTNI